MFSGALCIVCIVSQQGHALWLKLSYEIIYMPMKYFVHKMSNYEMYPPFFGNFLFCCWFMVCIFVISLPLLVFIYVLQRWYMYCRDYIISRSNRPILFIRAHTWSKEISLMFSGTPCIWNLVLFHDSFTIVVFIKR